MKYIKFACLYAILTSTSACAEIKQMPIREGIYFVYKSCATKHIQKNGSCKNGQAKLWEPIKNSDGKYITAYGSEYNQYDDFFFVYKKNRPSIFYSQSFAEGGYAIAWSDVEVKLLKNNTLTLTRHLTYQTSGDSLDGRDIDISVPKHQVGVVENYTEKYSFKGESSLVFQVEENGDLSMDCKKYKYYEPVQGSTVGPISNLCDEGTSRIWLKRIDTLPETPAQNDSIKQKNQSFQFENYYAEIYKGPQKGVYKDALNEIDVSKTKINFAGEYVVLQMQLGFDTTYYQIINARTGKAILNTVNPKDGFPALQSCEINDKNGEHYDDHVLSRANSKLLIAIGRQADGDIENGDCLVRYYQERDGRLQLIKKRLLVEGGEAFYLE